MRQTLTEGLILPLSSALRLILCTKQDIAGALILNHLLPRLSGHQVTVFLSNKTRDGETQIPELAHLKYLERDLPVGTVFPLVDALGPKRQGAKLTFNGLAARHGVALQVVDDINSSHWLNQVRHFAPDLILSVRFSNVFRAPVIALPRLGVFNVHPGALPHYAGLFPSFRAMMNAEPQIGCSLHRVDTSIDGGPLLGIGWTPTDLKRGLLWHVFKSYSAGLDLFTDLLPRLQAGEDLPGVAQDKSLRAYRSLPDAAQIRDFVQRGLHWYDPADYAATLAEFLPSGLNLPRT